MMRKFFGLRQVLAGLLVLACTSCGTPVPADTDVTDTTDTLCVTGTAETPPAVPTDVDLWAEALSYVDFKDNLTDQEALAYGSGAFDDYLHIHANPATAAELPMRLTYAAAEVGTDAAGLAGFMRDTAKDTAWKADMSVPGYPTAGTPAEAMALLFTAAGTEAGLTEAQAALGNLNGEIAPAFAEYLSTAAFVFGEYCREAAKIPAEEYEQMAAFAFCPPASTDHSSMQRIVEMAAKVDEAALLRAGVCLTDAASRLAQALTGCESLTVDGEALWIGTPAGRIVLGTAGDDVYDDASAFLLIDMDGKDTYAGCAAASVSQEKPVSVLIDLAGDDRYEADGEDGFAQGSGLLGAGLLFDLAGDDTYTAVRCAQGCTVLGTGVLFDGGGDDAYTADVSAQSFAVHGFAVLCDAAGDDEYVAYAYAQGSAGTRAAALLLDMAGDDLYRVEPYEIEGYAGLLYGQWPGVNGNWSQGCGAGNRNVTGAARGVSGGLGGLMDLAGKDRYNGGVWTQGVGYWSGIGFLTDMSGDDIYNAHYYSEASVAHYGVGVLADVGGDDRHTLVEGKFHAGEGAALGFVWDRGVAMLVNDGGDDTYRLTTYSFASSWSAYDEKGMLQQDQNYAFFLDTEGDDYYTSCTEPGFGRGRGGFFFDLAGDDYYGHAGSEDDLTDYGVRRERGVFIDRNPAGGERFTVEFWEAAKAGGEN